MTDAAPRLSILAPAHDEQDNLVELVERLDAVAASIAGGCELVVVDDGSTDRTPQILAELQARCARLRVLHLPGRGGGRGQGQSAAFWHAIRAARGATIALLDADLQNDPAEIPRLLAEMDAHHADMVQGDRSRNRRDTVVRKASSLVGRAFRRWLLADTIRDTGCSLRVLRREVALKLPLEFAGMHRFIPITARQLGYRVIEVSVSHHPRTRGASKYGIMNRAIPGLIDCLAVRWMRNRRRDVTAEERGSGAPPAR